MEFIECLMAFLSCVYLITKCLLLLAVIGFVLGWVFPKMFFIPTAIGYFFVSFSLLIFSWPLSCIFQKRELRIFQVKSVVDDQDMPVLRPIPNPTKNQNGWFDKLLSYMFVPRTWMLMQNFHCVYKVINSKKEIVEIKLVLPKGFTCDAASIPRPFRALFNPTGALLIPALLHDYAFKYNQLWYVDENNNYNPYPPDNNFFEKKSSEEQRNYWDKFLFESGQQLNGLCLVNATIRLLGWIRLTKKTWEQYRALHGPVQKPLKSVPGNGCLCKFALDSLQR